MKVLKKFIPIIIVSIFAYVGCTKDTLVPVDLGGKVFSFSEDIEPLLESQCSACHPHTDLGGADPYGFMTDNNWITTDTTQATESKLYKKINTSHVDGRLNDTQKSTLEEWMKQGAQNN